MVVDIEILLQVCYLENCLVVVAVAASAVAVDLEEAVAAASEDLVAAASEAVEPAVAGK